MNDSLKDWKLEYEEANKNTKFDNVLEDRSHFKLAYNWLSVRIVGVFISAANLVIKLLGGDKKA